MILTYFIKLVGLIKTLMDYIEIQIPMRRIPLGLKGLRMACLYIIMHLFGVF
jgi:hypothetical protein